MRNNIRILGFLLSFCLWLNFTNIYAQLEVTQESDAEKLAKAFVGIGLEVSNATLTCPEGGSGFFNGEFTNLGINEGIALCSGTIDEMPGPNDESGATGINTCVDGDQDLNDIIIGFTTNDACILEFDFIPYSENLSFNYVFGSEEYLEYVGSSFNDVFAFFIEGPGVPFQNIALIPGTTVPVSINNLNDASNSEYYVDNGSGFLLTPTRQCNTMA
ncbi:MAG: choice-of-anchor L domain-containing protein [Sphingobacteriales bacterium]|nr:choice-of-anchor L domain-containing protein [Sphingobacteriales bacterium]